MLIGVAVKTSDYANRCVPDPVPILRGEAAFTPGKTEKTGSMYKGVRVSDAVKMLLEDEKRPLRTRELADGILKKGFRYKKGPVVLRRTIAGVIDREIRVGEVFKKISPGLYALVEWENK